MKQPRTSQYFDADIQRNTTEAFESPLTAYDQDVFNRRGLTKEGNLIWEVAAETILTERLWASLDKIEPKSRKDYDASRSLAKCEDSLRDFFREHSEGVHLFDEVRLEWLVYYLSRHGELELDTLGLAESLEVPIDNKKGHAVDLVSSTPTERFLIEFKQPGSKEALLRALLEISTYKREIAERIPSATPALLIWSGSAQDNELSAMAQGNRPHLRQLFQELGVHAYAMRWVNSRGASDPSPFESAVRALETGTVELRNLCDFLTWNVEPRFIPDSHCNRTGTLLERRNGLKIG